MKKYYACVDNSIEMEINEECVLQCAHSGHCDNDVQRWLEVDEIRIQFKNSHVKKCARTLENGAHLKKEN